MKDVKRRNLITNVEIGAVRDEKADDLRVLALDGEVQRGLQVGVLQVGARAAADQQLGHLRVVVEGGQVQRRVPVVLRVVHYPLAGQLAQHYLHGTEGQHQILDLNNQI